MFCPKCGQERISTDTSFCSRCGFLLTGTSDLLLTGGVLPQISPQKGFRAATRRNHGLKQGLFIFLLTFLIVPLIAIITVAVRAEPYAVVIASILLSVGGILRMAYALMFESNIPGGQTLEDALNSGQALPHHRTQSVPALPPQQSYPVSSYAAPAAGNWRETNDVEPRSVTESTTKLLENEDLPQ